MITTSTRQPDGSRFELALPRQSWNHKWYSRANLRTGPRSYNRVAIGPVGSEETMWPLLEEAAVGQGAVAEYMVAGRRVLAREYDGQTTYVWQGDNHELTLVQNGTGIAIEGFVDFLAGFEFTDTAEGLLIDSSLPGRQRVVDPQLAVAVGDRSSVQCFTLKDERRNLPRGRGKQVAGGELWVIEPDSPNERHRFLIANDTAVTLIRHRFLPLDDQFVEFVESIVVEHQAA